MSDSKKLLLFIKKFNIPMFSKLSEPSKKMISNIVNKMEEAAKSWSEYKDNILDLSHDFPKGNSYDHIVMEIKEEFENQTKIGKQFLFSIGSRNFNIYIIKPIVGSQNTRAIYKMFDKMIYKIYIWLFICNHYSNPACSPDIAIYIYMTNHKKMLPEINNKLLDGVHANTAFTFACPTASNEIYIFRNEEWFKVFIHESFHCFGLDFSTLSEAEKETEKKMFSIFPVKCNLRLYETYTETWAEIINTIFISVNTYSCNENKINMNKLSKTIENHLYNEQMFSLFQCSKVLHYLNIKYRELYEKKDHAQETYREKTHIFSYYILKSIVIFYYNDFIEWCIIHNNNSIQFTQTQENINQFFEFIKSKYNSDDYLRTIEIFENWFWFSKERNQYNKKWELKTMRMSISE
jgi:hypothetical protein